MKQKLASVKNYVATRERKILVTALVVTTTVAVLTRVGLSQHDQFLKEHDLYTAFYLPED